MKRQKRILYVFDDINYINGVQKVTALQIANLKEDYDVSLFSLIKPQEHIKELFSNLPVLGEEIWDKMQAFSSSLGTAITSNEYNFRQKIIRLVYAINFRVCPNKNIIDYVIKNHMEDKLKSFDIIIVLSESSKIRSIVGSLEKPIKIQWIHTDYGRWREQNDWTRAVTKNDKALYQCFDKIITLSNNNKESFLKVYPEFTNKTTVIWNMIPIREILEKSMLPLDNFTVYSGLNIISISRLDQEKALDRLLRVCKRLKLEGYKFHWYLVGDGDLYDKIKNQLIDLEVGDTVILTGMLENPMPLLRQCDFLALLSEYEGMPVTIHEAMILGTPVIATNVGGIPEQVDNGINGMLLENNEEAIFNGMKSLLDNPWQVSKFSKKLEGYKYDNDSILRELKLLFEEVAK